MNGRGGMADAPRRLRADAGRRGRPHWLQARTYSTLAAPATISRLHGVCPMTRTAAVRWVAVAAAVLGGAGAGDARSVGTPAGEDRDLFNGQDLDGWVIDGPAADRAGKPVWSVRDGLIVATGQAFGF